MLRHALRLINLQVFTDKPETVVKEVRKERVLFRVLKVVDLFSCQTKEVRRKQPKRSNDRVELT